MNFKLDASDFKIDSKNDIKLESKKEKAVPDWVNEWK